MQASSVHTHGQTLNLQLRLLLHTEIMAAFLFLCCAMRAYNSGSTQTLTCLLRTGLDGRSAPFGSIPFPMSLLLLKVCCLTQQHSSRGVGAALVPPLRPQKPFCHVLRETATPRKNACKPTDFFFAPTPLPHPLSPPPSAFRRRRPLASGRPPKSNALFRPRRCPTGARAHRHTHAYVDIRRPTFRHHLRGRAILRGRAAAARHRRRRGHLHC